MCTSFANSGPLPLLFADSIFGSNPGKYELVLIGWLVDLFRRVATIAGLFWPRFSHLLVYLVALFRNVGSFVLCVWCVLPFQIRARCPYGSKTPYMASIQVRGSGGSVVRVFGVGDGVVGASGAMGGR